MTAGSRLDKVRSITGLLTSETRYAINLQRMFARCADKMDVLSPFDHEPEVWGFSTVQSALHMSLISTLGRIHDSANHNESSLEAARRCLTDPGVRRLLLSQEEDPADVALYLDELLRAMDNPELREMVTIIREVRDKRVAHRDHRKRVYRARYGHERELLELTVPIVHDLGIIVHGVHTQLQSHLEQTVQLADRFWRTVAAGQRKKKRDRELSASV